LVFTTDKRFKTYTLLAIALCIPAFLLNLGITPFIGDEAIRALVALEMMLSDNYLVPTMRGEFYFSKPPLYNWILIVFFKMFGEVNEWVTRFPTVIFSWAFTGVIWFFNRKNFEDRRQAIILAFTFLTCGRMLFYDSFLGLIDIFFSMVTYSLMIGCYLLVRKEKWTEMYAYLYALSVIGFMLKGLPILHFSGFALLIIHGMYGNWKLLYYKKHLIPLITAIGVLVLYFYLYNLYREASHTLNPLVDQAARRTILKYGLIDVVKHMFTYPLENIYHFFPWSLMGLLVFQKNIVAQIRSNPYVTYVVLSFLLNFAIYWVSPEVYPRYILMLIPLIFSVWIYLYGFELGRNTLRMQIVSWIFIALTWLVPIIIASQFGNPRLDYVEGQHVKMMALVTSLAGLAVLYWKDQPNRPMLFVIYLLVLRVGFNVLIVPVRAVTGDDEYYKREATRIGRTYQDIKLFEDAQLNHITTFYITQQTGNITNKTADLREAKYFIIDSCAMNQFALIDSFPDASFCGTRWVVKGRKP
jgi:4-amino-4-deoxy-L-arabinose transferase-like glycosyltransferase